MEKQIEKKACKNCIHYVKRPLAWALFQTWKKVDQMRGGAE